MYDIAAHRESPNYQLSIINYQLSLTSAPQVKRLLAEHGLRPKKRLGQNFLIDHNVLRRIADACEAGPDSHILEIGPGLGVVTRELAERGANVLCVEADGALEPILREVLADQPRVEIVIGDFLKADMPEFLSQRAAGRWLVVGNLPYHITSPAIAKLIEARSHIRAAVLMVQKEVAQRLQAPPGSEARGALSIFVQYYCDIKNVTRVSRNVFYPIPNVDSELIKLTVLENPRVDVRDEKAFFAIVKAAFGQRRKTLLNALSSSPELNWGKERSRAALDAAGLDPAARGETLSLEEFARLVQS